MCVYIRGYGLLCFFLFLAMFFGGKVFASDNAVDVFLGGSVEDTLSSSKIGFSKECLDGVCFYGFSKSASSADLPSVSLSGGVVIFGVSSIELLADEAGDKKVRELDLMMAPYPDGSSDGDNRTFFYSVVARLSKAGWERHIALSQPRVFGKEAVLAYEEDKEVRDILRKSPMLDAAYEMTNEEWESLPPSSAWMMHNRSKGEYLRITVQKMKSEQLSGKSSYVYSFSFYTERAWYQQYFKGEEKGRWLELLPTMIKSMHDIRLQKERALCKLGLNIDETYQDPKVKSLQR
ncbi:hypothetical protein [Salinicola sp. RZ23]|uniref:hypothetical protein n=1 Tax=Salinicola sp. RZ23 TaxID=1949087 RepID=UPI00130032F9|nr:hypothetical protein [Salinicola sp. RZ23]